MRLRLHDPGNVRHVGHGLCRRLYGRILAWMHRPFRDDQATERPIRRKGYRRHTTSQRDHPLVTPYLCHETWSPSLAELHMEQERDRIRRPRQPNDYDQQ